MPRLRTLVNVWLCASVLPLLGETTARAAVTAEEVSRAIRDGVRYLKSLQKDDGSWPEVEQQSKTGTTSLVTLALLTAGEPTNSPAVSKALDYLRGFLPNELDNTYAVSLHSMALAAANSDRDLVRISADADWLISTQIKPNEGRNSPGTWSYSRSLNRGDPSNTQYALLGLHAASEAGVKVPPQVWSVARAAWVKAQHPDGSWAYPGLPSSASMTSAGISSLVITGLNQYQGHERLVGDEIVDCGKGSTSRELELAVGWMARNFDVRQNVGQGNQWRYYYLYGLERAGRLTGQRFFGEHDWYREGAEALVREQNRVTGAWVGLSMEKAFPQLTTSFSLLFLAKGRSPVLVNKLRHGPRNDWNHDVDDIRNLVNTVSRDWKTLLTWQVVNPDFATVEDMLQSPIVYFNGHTAPEFTPQGKKNLRDYVEQGGFIFAEACCSRPEFHSGFQALMEEIFPEPEYKLHPLPEDHAVWRAKHQLSPDVHELWGIEHGCRTVVIYAPSDLSCYWNQAEASPTHPAVIKALRVGQNVIDYATGRELPADKLAVREVKDFKLDSPKRGAMHIAKLRHAGDWNVAPLAIPNLTTSLRDRLGFDVVINHKELPPRDPNLSRYPLIYVHGRANFQLSPEDRDWLRKHLEPGGGTLFADAACGSPAFDNAFRRVVAEMLPKHPLVPIPPEDDLYTDKIGYDLSKVRYTRAAGGGQKLPQLEGVKIDGHWAIIYSKYDLGCALERHQGPDCKGYDQKSAEMIASNIVIYATLP
ncbi:DUF4159 domain-containing protein [Singulisphaera rosea]